MKSIFKICIFLSFLFLISCHSGGNGNVNDDTACGKLGLENYDKIINGETCNDANSSIVRLNIITDDDEGTCTGTIISEDTVLTAAHCVNEKHNKITIDQGMNNYNAIEVVYHPMFEIIKGSISGSSEVYPHDIALVKIADTFKVKAMPIITSKLPKNKERLIVAGYGLTEDVDIPLHLKAAFMKVKDSKSIGFTMAYDDTNTNVCNGDSGGPAFGETKYGLGIYGITSAGTNEETCLSGDITFFPSLSLKENLDWILSYTNPSTL